MRDRLTSRILALVPPTPTGRGLIVLRDSLIEAALKDQGMKFKPTAHRPSRDRDDSYQDGRDAADKVSLNQGVSGSQPSRLIGRVK